MAQKMIQVKDRLFKLMLTGDQIRKRVCELASDIVKDYGNKDPLCLVILNGAFVFAADLVREMDMITEVAFIRLSSYKKLNSSGQVSELMQTVEPLANRDIIIIEDIVDTGLTIQHLYERLRNEGARSWKVVSLLSKEGQSTQSPESNYTGFVIPDRFVVGYGLDYDGYGRNLKDIYQLI